MTDDQNKDQHRDQDLEADLLAYMNGQLDPDRAFEVAEYLARQPEHAAAMFSDASTTEGLRVALDQIASPAPEALIANARQLEKRLWQRRIIARAVPVAAALAMFAIGWPSHGLVQSTKQSATVAPVVEAALDAQAALDLRHWMVSQPESVVLNSAEIVAALGIDIPTLPKDWVVWDVQVVSAPERPAVAIALDTPEFGRIMLFSMTRAPFDEQDPLDAFEYEGRAVAVFERGRAAYVLVDNSGHPEQLSHGASQLMSMFN